MTNSSADAEMHNAAVKALLPVVLQRQGKNQMMFRPYYTQEVEAC